MLYKRSKYSIRGHNVEGCLFLTYSGLAELEFGHVCQRNSARTKIIVYLGQKWFLRIDKYSTEFIFALIWGKNDCGEFLEIFLPYLLEAMFLHIGVEYKVQHRPQEGGGSGLKQKC